MFKMAQRVRKKRGDSQPGTSCFSKYAVFLTGKWGGEGGQEWTDEASFLTRDRAEVLLRLGRAKRREALEVDTEPTSCVDFERTKVVLGPER